MLLLIQKCIKSVRLKVPNSVSVSKRKQQNQINHYDKRRQVLMSNSTVCQRNRKQIVLKLLQAHIFLNLYTKSQKGLPQKNSDSDRPCCRRESSPLLNFET